MAFGLRHHHRVDQAQGQGCVPLAQLRGSREILLVMRVDVERTVAKILAKCARDVLLGIYADRSIGG
jgi:hypothetical protein